MPRQDRKQREFERREQDILETSLQLFSRPGWESVTIEQIANAADIGKGTVYKHFSSKDELLFRLMLRFYEGLLQAFKQEFSEDEDIRERFRRVFDYSLRYHLDHREYRYVVEYCNRIDFKERADESWHASFLELDQAFREWANPMVLEAMDRGMIQKRPLVQVMVGLHACFDGAIAMLWAGKDWCPLGDEEDVIEAVTAFMMSGFIGQV